LVLQEEHVNEVWVSSLVLAQDKAEILVVRSIVVKGSDPIDTVELLRVVVFFAYGLTFAFFNKDQGVVTVGQIHLISYHELSILKVFTES
jgi:lipoprotein signal peptidase